MSFDFNVASVKPVIREAASMNNDGGGGNLGYMAQGKKEKEENKEKFYLTDDSIFAKNEGKDVFGFSKEPVMPDEKFSFAGWINKLIEAIKRIF